MDRFEKRILLVTGLLIGVFLFAILVARDVKKIDLPSCVPYDRAYLEPGIKQIDSRTFSVFCVAGMWAFEPADMTFPAGSEVDFYLSSKDVVHGFHIYEKNVNLMAVPGGIGKTTVRFDKPGIYHLVCHEYCGTGHQNMQAEITVK